MCLASLPLCSAAAKTDATGTSAASCCSRRGIAASGLAIVRFSLGLAEDVENVTFQIYDDGTFISAI